MFSKMKHLLPEFGTLMTRYRVPGISDLMEHDSRIVEFLMFYFIISLSMMA